MARFHSHVNTAKVILSSYNGQIPFAAFLKSFFAKEKKYGSRDRKTISSLCYNYFRTGAVDENDIDRKLLLSLFLCSDRPNEFLQSEKPEWNEQIHLLLTEKLKIAGITVESVLPFNNELSPEVDVKAFNTSFLVQPDLFVRIRPGKQAIVKKKLQAANIDCKEIGDTSLAFQNGTKLESVLDINAEAVIQDLSSQRVGEVLMLANLPQRPKVWDCCAASGGKSIMAYDLLADIQLTVSDVRQSIIQNLQKRLQQAGIKNYTSFVADVTNNRLLKQALGNQQFDVIICDAPCSGSGTWSRTPEQLLYFKPEEIKRYSNLQKSIAANSLRYLQKGGYFLYITCSVFRQENEEVVDFILQQPYVGLIHSELLKGYDEKADSMFAALFKMN